MSLFCFIRKKKITNSEWSVRMVLMCEWNVFSLENEEVIVFIEYRVALITIRVESVRREISHFIMRIKGSARVKFARITCSCGFFPVDWSLNKIERSFPNQFQ